MSEKTKTGTVRFWALVWGLGLAGQLCWNTENQWFNTFVYAKIAKNATIVTLMVITSALVSTFATFFFGTMSDRRGTRRRFIALGYIAWGVLTIGFGLTQYLRSGTVGTETKVSLLVVLLVVLADDVMSFFGSMGNDSGYNAWTNDNTTDGNRGQVALALALTPVIGTIVGTIAGGMLIGSQDNYQRLFWVMGGVVILLGVCSLLFLKDAPGLAPYREGSFWRQFGTVFSFRKQFFAHRELLLACLVAAVYFISFNVYFVYMGNWMIYYMGFTPDQMGYIQGGGLIAAMVLSIPTVGLINRHKTPLVAGAAIAINIVGLWVLYGAALPGRVDAAHLLSARNVPMFVGVFLVGAGYVLIMQTVTIWVKQLYPESNRGQFEGVRLTFFTLIPMLIGTVLGNIIVTTGAGTVVNDYGITENIPTEAIFFWAAWIVVLAFVPLFFAGRRYFARVREGAGVADPVG